jgi:cytochrome c oxidase subunit 3
MASEHGQPSYYVPEQSKYPFLASVGVGLMLVGVATWLNDLKSASANASPNMLIAGFLIVATVIFCWFRTAISESIKGMNSAQLSRSYRIGMQWFIFSEVMFFFTFFGGLFYVRELVGPWLGGEGVGVMTNKLLWSGFHFSWPMMQTPQDAVGVANQVIANNGIFTGPKENMSWPGVSKAAHWLPLWNTLFLVTSSVTCEFAHHALKAGKKSRFNMWLGVTLVLGFLFVYFQGVEYHEAYAEMGLKLTSGIYGSTFFMLTGFHGFHVCLGAFILTVMFLRSTLKGHFNKDDHFGFEAASWYWHFVDVVWLFLVAVVYVF